MSYNLHFQFNDLVTIFFILLSKYNHTIISNGRITFY